MRVEINSFRLWLWQAVLVGLCSAGSCVAQDKDDVQLVVSPYYMRTLYRGLDNAVDVAVPGVNCEDLKISISQGTLTGAGCSYIIDPPLRGKSSLTMEAKWIESDGKHSSSVTFRVSDIPLPQACFAGSCEDRDTISSKVASIGQGLIARIMDLGFDFPLRVDHYRLQVLRNCTEVDSGITEGPELSLGMKSFMQHLESGDQLLFSQIRVMYPDGSERQLPPFHLVIR